MGGVEDCLQSEGFVGAEEDGWRESGGGGADFVEEVGGGAEDVAGVVVAGDAGGEDAGVEGGAEILCVGEGGDAGVPGAKGVGSEFVLGGVRAGKALSILGFDAETGDDGEGDRVGCEVAQGLEVGEVVADASVRAEEELLAEEAAPGVLQES